MIAWANFASMIATALLTVVYYIKSVSPAALERRIGEIAYAKCARYRIIASIFMTAHFLLWVVYYFFPLPLPIRRTFPWPWRVSVLIATLIAIPSGYLMYRGVRDAGEETAFPKKEHRMYGGIYQQIRHPQAVGETPFAWVFAFLLNSPFLALFSFLWVPIFAIIAWSEERDLLLRYGNAYREYRDRTGAIFPRRR